MEEEPWYVISECSFRIYMLHVVVNFVSRDRYIIAMIILCLVDEFGIIFMDILF